MNIRLPSEKLFGIYHLGRFIDKAHLKNQGKLSEEYLASFCSPKGLDGLFIDFFKLDQEEFLEAVANSSDTARDQEIVSWVLSKVSEEQIEEWNEFAFNLGRPGTPSRERFEQVLPVKYPNLPPDFPGTVFEAIEADEKN
ncbi:DUF5069 domain-containing protein [Pelagicoccus albus]|uniref:DUF5069 domain-containing protein n=1 Tax=Pelagicoccus albus TaxID=415222 RepID=A0A7X1B562_9BACT|nr:DUF5069 domain-containing protein [Pelagicoccus albus]MBC2605843.1 DUF5069 domain-containing protein [Pelagicoccus albus]